MSADAAVEVSPEGHGRATCYRCFRPQVRCICGRCQRVDNQTFVHILQHPRERFHPFGTARIAELSLARVRVHVAFGRTQHDAYHPLSLPADTALLYPGPQAQDIASLPPDERPRNLLVLDGTWRQAHQLFRDNPWLSQLPSLRIAPNEPSRYRIRREPAPHCLSTVESIALALHALEPRTPSIWNLRKAFESMIDQQLAHDFDPSVLSRRKLRRVRESRAVPADLRVDPARLVVVYGESSQITARKDPKDPELLQWTALRLATGESFERFLRPSRGSVDEAFMACMQLSGDHLTQAVSTQDLQRDWRAFSAPQDVLLAWNGSTLRLLASAGVALPSTILLKAAYANSARRRPGKLEAVMAREGLQPVDVAVRGRARERLGNAAAVVAWLRARPRLTRGYE